MRKNILNLLIFLHAVTANAQTLNMRYDDSYNICHVNAIVDNVLLKVLGEKRIEEWLTTDKLKLLIRWSVDKKGKVCGAQLFRKANIEFDENDLNEIVGYIIRHDVRLPVPLVLSVPWYKYNYLHEEKELLNKKGDNPRFNFVTGFPGIYDYHVSADSTLTVIQKLRKTICKHIKPKMYEAVAVAEQKVHYDQQYFDAFDTLTDIADRADYCSKRDKLVSLIVDLSGSNGNTNKSVWPELHNMKKQELTAFAFGVLMSEYYKRYGDYDFFVWMCINRIMELNEVIK